MVHALLQSWSLESCEWIAKQQLLYFARLRLLAPAAGLESSATLEARFMELFEIYKARRRLRRALAGCRTWTPRYRQPTRRPFPAPLPPPASPSADGRSC